MLDNIFSVAIILSMFSGDILPKHDGRIPFVINSILQNGIYLIRIEINPFIAFDHRLNGGQSEQVEFLLYAFTTLRVQERHYFETARCERVSEASEFYFSSFFL